MMEMSGEKKLRQRTATRFRATSSSSSCPTMLFSMNESIEQAMSDDTDLHEFLMVGGETGGLKLASWFED
jgi:hypothetical protein